MLPNVMVARPLQVTLWLCSCITKQLLSLRTVQAAQYAERLCTEVHAQQAHARVQQRCWQQLPTISQCLMRIKKERRVLQPQRKAHHMQVVYIRLAINHWQACNAHHCQRKCVTQQHIDSIATSTLVHATHIFIHMLTSPGAAKVQKKQHLASLFNHASKGRSLQCWKTLAPPSARRSSSGHS
jgi:hypothetical protein